MAHSRECSMDGTLLPLLCRITGISGSGGGVLWGIQDEWCARGVQKRRRRRRRKVYSGANAVNEEDSERDRATLM